jgi:hypothetical protein
MNREDRVGFGRLLSLLWALNPIDDGEPRTETDEGYKEKKKSREVLAAEREERIRAMRMQREREKEREQTDTHPDVGA